MAGLYDGVEETAFKPIAGGYLFQSRNPWFFGPSRRYLVDEAQKAAIAETLRQTMQRVKPFVIAWAILMPLVMAGAIAWLVTEGPNLVVTRSGPTGESIVLTKPFGRDGVRAEVTMAPGRTFTYIFSGPPGEGRTVSFLGPARECSADHPCVWPFGAGGMNVNFSDGDPKNLSVFHFGARTGEAPTTVAFYAVALGLALFAPYIALMHVYGMRRLQPLLAGLPRTRERITWREGLVNFAAKASTKLLVLLAAAPALMLVAAAMQVVDAIVDGRPIASPAVALSLLSAAVAIPLIAFVAYGILLKSRRSRSPS